MRLISTFILTATALAVTLGIVFAIAAKPEPLQGYEVCDLSVDDVILRGAEDDNGSTGIIIHNGHVLVFPGKTAQAGGQLGSPLTPDGTFFFVMMDGAADRPDFVLFNDKYVVRVPFSIIAAVHERFEAKATEPKHNDDPKWTMPPDMEEDLAPMRKARLK